MSEWMFPIVYFMCGATLSLTVLGLVMAAVMPVFERWDKHFFVTLFSILVLCMLTYLIEAIYLPDPNMVLLEKAAGFLDSLLISMPMSMFTVYLLHCCGEELKSSSLFFAVTTLWVVYVILLIVAQFTNVFYYVAPDNQFITGPFYQLLIIPVILIITLNLAGVIRRRNVISKENMRAFLFFLIPLMASMIIFIYIENYLIVDIGIVISVLSMFFMVLSYQRVQQMRQQQEIMKQEASIKVLQMRPHFIYNTMTSIYYLCEQDPGKAQQVTMDFTTYLRKNFTAIVSNDTIPFSDELEHTRAYVAVEQAGYDDMIIVEYDTPHTLFRVPPLTLQPIVENAIKHGMDPDAGPIRISIRTLETESGSEITVEDNGVGFEPSDNNEPHIALENIKHRLEIMCSGEMTITPREGGGTVVRIIIP